MTPLDLPGLIVIAGRTLGLDTPELFGLLDLPAAEQAIAEADPAASRGDLAAGAAALLSALLRHHPWDRGNDEVAVAAMTMFLAINDWQADLDPPEAACAIIAATASGSLPTADLAAWLAPRLTPGELADHEPRADQEPRAKEVPMQNWLPGRGRASRKRAGRGSTARELFPRFTPQARSAIVAAQSEARLLQHNYIGTEHLLLGLLDDGETLAMRALQASGISQQAAREKILAIIGHGQEEPAGHIPFTPRSKKVLELSLREATAQDQIYIGTEHVLLALLREGRGLACQVLHELGADTPGLRHQIQVLSGHRQVPDVVTVPPPGIHDYDVRIAQARQDKDAAIDAGEHERAAAARGSEKELLAERDRLIADWVAGVDVANLGRELDRLRDEVRRLQELLLQHGIEPQEPGQQTA